MGSYLPLIYLFLCPLQAGDRPGQLQSNPSLNGGGVQTIHFPVSLSRPRTGKGREHRQYKSVQKEENIPGKVLHVASCSHVSLISSMQKLLPFRNSQEKTTSMLELAQVSFCAVCELKFE